MDYIILALATFRIAYALTEPEDGPYNVILRFRDWIGIRFDEHSQPYGTNVFAEAFTCLYCLSIWIGIILAGLYWYNSELMVLISLPFA